MAIGYAELPRGGEYPSVNRHTRKRNPSRASVRKERPPFSLRHRRINPGAVSLVKNTAELFKNAFVVAKTGAEVTAPFLRDVAVVTKDQTAKYAPVIGNAAVDGMGEIGGVTRDIAVTVASNPVVQEAAINTTAIAGMGLAALSPAVESRVSPPVVDAIQPVVKIVGDAKDDISKGAHPMSVIQKDEVLVSPVQGIKPPVGDSGIQLPPENHYKIDPSLSIEDNRIKNQTDALIAAIPEYAGFPDIKEKAREAIPLLIKALQAEGYTSNEALAFTVADTEVECKFDPGKEIDAETQAAVNGYEGGDKYAGWGYIQLTGEPNYQAMQDATGLPLVEHPELAGVPENAALILAKFYKINGVGRFAEQGEFIKARAIINSGEVRSSDQRIKNTPYTIKNKADHYLEILDRLG